MSSLLCRGGSFIPFPYKLHLVHFFDSVSTIFVTDVIPPSAAQRCLVTTTSVCSNRQGDRGLFNPKILHNHCVSTPPTHKNQRAPSKHNSTFSQRRSQPSWLRESYRVRGRNFNPHKTFHAYLPP